MDLWGILGLAMIAGIIVLCIIFLPWIAIPVIIVAAIAIALYVFLYKRTKNKVKDGRLTREIIEYLKENDRYLRLSDLTIYPDSVSLRTENVVKSFDLAKPLSSNEMSALAVCVCEAFDRTMFEIKHYDASKGGSYTPEVGSVAGQKIYGKTEYYDGWEEHIIVELKPRPAPKPKFTGGSNW